MSGPVAFVCDGGGRIGAGHVGRCLPIANAFAARGWEPVFCGQYEGLAARMITGAGFGTAGRAAARDNSFGGAVLDSYDLTAEEIRALASTHPICTVAEAARVDDLGIHLDFHADRAGEPSSDRELVGPQYAPLDPALAGARRDRSDDVETVLVTFGASAAAAERLPQAIADARAAFPYADVWAAGPDEIVRAAGATRPPRERLDADLLAEVGVALSAAGHTAYELACAGVPAALVELADNQRRIITGAKRTGFAHTGPIAEIADAGLRVRLATRGPEVVDGRGAERTAAALERLWSGG